MMAGMSFTHTAPQAAATTFQLRVARPLKFTAKQPTDFMHEAKCW